VRSNKLLIKINKSSSQYSLNSRDEKKLVQKKISRQKNNTVVRKIHKKKSHNIW